jgi:hypothetical protein
VFRATLRASSAAQSARRARRVCREKEALFRRANRCGLATGRRWCAGRRRLSPWRHATAVHREQRRPATERNDIWSMDFVADELADGRRFRTLTVIDLFTRECLAIEAGQELGG